MASNEKQDSLYPMREEMRKRMQNLPVLAQTSTLKVIHPAPLRSRSLPTQSQNLMRPKENDEPKRSMQRSKADNEQLLYQEQTRIKDLETQESDRAAAKFKKSQLEFKHKQEQRNQDWQSRRRAPMEDFGDAYAEYKAKQKRKDDEIEERNKRYAQMHRENRRLAEELKQLKLKPESSKRLREDDLPTPTTSPSKPPKSQKPRREAHPPAASLSPTQPPPKQRFKTVSSAGSTSSAKFVEQQEEEMEESMLNISISDSFSLEVTNGELIAYMRTTGLKYTNPLQKKLLLEYIYKKLNVSEDQLSKTEQAELQKTVSKFHSTFCKKFSDSKVSRTISRLVSDRWCSAQLNLPKTIVNRLTAKSFTVEKMDIDLPQKEQISFSYEELSSVMQNNSNCAFTDTQNQVVALKEYILQKTSITEGEEEDCIKELEEKLRSFVVKIQRKYNKSNQIFDRLKKSLVQNNTDDSKKFQLPQSIINKVKEKHTKTLWAIEDDFVSTGSSQSPKKRSDQRQPEQSRATKSRSPEVPPEQTSSESTRKETSFAEKSKRAQQYACRNLRDSVDPDLIVATAAQVVNPACGRLIRKANSATGLTAQAALDALSKNKQEIIKVGKYTADESLAYVLNHNLTKQSYLDMKAASTSKGANIWPDYNQILEAKKKCRPEGIEVSELEASVPMQNLLDHTGKRIFSEDLELYEKVKLLAAKNGGELNVTMYFKYGMDGCGSFSSFMQKDSAGELQDMSSLLTCQMVPLQAVAISEGQKVVVYHSQFPNSAN